MNGWRFGLALLLVLALTRSGFAGDIVRFETGPRAQTNVVLANVPVKALVTEYLDPGDTGVGKSVGYLVWREILTAISDQAGAGVILARAPGNRRLTDLLEQTYHEAALRIAREQAASMAVWGAVGTVGDTTYVTTYLTLLPETSALQLKLRLVAEPALPPGLEADIKRTTFNFPPVETTKAKLFQRRVVTRKATTVRAGTTGSSATVESVPKGVALDALDMDKGWFKVQTASKRVGYVDNADVDVPPSTVDGAGVTVGLLSAPGGARLKTVTLAGIYRVRDMRYTNGLWYQLDVDGSPGWVPAGAVKARFSLPIVHFVAGLYRYQFKRYEIARSEFAQYVSAPDVAADNASLATAYQLLGASALLAKPTVFQTDAATVNFFSKAVTLTPYDPSAYSLRALSILALQQKGSAALLDLESALELDATDATAARITSVIREQVTKPGGNPLKRLLRDGDDPTLRQKTLELEKRYKLASAPNR